MAANVSWMLFITFLDSSSSTFTLTRAVLRLPFSLPRFRFRARVSRSLSELGEGDVADPDPVLESEGSDSEDFFLLSFFFFCAFFPLLFIDFRSDCAEFS
jgi:hypothetical protein